MEIISMIAGIIAGKLGGWAILATIAQIKMGIRGVKRHGFEFLIVLSLIAILYIIVFVAIPLAIFRGLPLISFTVVAAVVVVLWLDKALTIDEDEDIKKLLG